MKYDILIIGSGPAGHAAAVKAAQNGKRVAIIERAEAGGTCTNWGCIPTKALLRSAQVFAECRQAAAFGVEVEGTVTPDIAKMVARSRTVAETLGKGIRFMLQKSGVELIEGEARLTSAHTVEVDGQSYEADHIIIATGSRPRELPQIPVDHRRVITSKDALQLTSLPAEMIIVGSGAIGCEFAQLYATLGVKITIVEYLPQIMPIEDAEIAQTMERMFRRQRIATMTSTTVKSVTLAGERCRVEIEGKKGAEVLECDMVLSAVGIKSNIENLGLEQVGIKVERDKIVVDDNYRTSVEGVYAVGDIIATPALAHTATAEARHCVDAILGGTPAKVDYRAIPSCVFTAPEVASVGTTERQVAAEGVEYFVGRFQFAASGKAMAAGERDGFIKLIFDAKHRLTGAHLVGAHVTEILGEPTIAVALGTTAEELAHTVHAHPTLHEGVAEAAADALHQIAVAAKEPCKA